mmetsp:Transcript_34382/g.78349  ORF Transcript_34382/g.78349 Transcript_34382/m.78349 type:complete len:211 (-) Transcript_34382:750-1382(-)
MEPPAFLFGRRQSPRAFINCRLTAMSILLRGLMTSRLKRKAAPLEHSKSTVATPDPSRETPDCDNHVNPPASVAVSNGTSLAKDTPLRSFPSLRALSRTRNARYSRASVRYCGPKPSPIIMITEVGCPHGKIPSSGTMQRGHWRSQEPKKPPSRKAIPAAKIAVVKPVSLSCPLYKLDPDFKGDLVDFLPSKLYMEQPSVVPSPPNPFSF